MNTASLKARGAAIRTRVRAIASKWQAEESARVATMQRFRQAFTRGGVRSAEFRDSAGDAIAVAEKWLRHDLPAMRAILAEAVQLAREIGAPDAGLVLVFEQLAEVEAQTRGALKLTKKALNTEGENPAGSLDSAQPHAC